MNRNNITKREEKKKIVTGPTVTLVQFFFLVFF